MSPLELRWSRRHEGLQAANSHLDERLGGRKSELQMALKRTLELGSKPRCDLGHTIKGFGLVNKAEMDVFSETRLFLQ